MATDFLEVHLVLGIVLLGNDEVVRHDALHVEVLDGDFADDVVGTATQVYDELVALRQDRKLFLVL